MDEFAFHDIPDSIDYILSTTSAPSLSYIGFSQGTAQAFATLAIHPKLNEKVDVFIALAPAMSPAGLTNGFVDGLIKASPQVLFLLFGRRSILSSATMWQSILYPPIFVRLIDMGLSFLFGWHAKNMAMSQKLAAYPHLYSFSSTKSVVHWFQIIRTKSFQMWDDSVNPPLTVGSVSKYTKVHKFPTRNIKTPIALLYGGSDSLVDITVMLKELPSHTIATEIPHYEHLDFLWAREVDTLVFPHVFDALESFSDASHSKEEYERYRSARHASILGANKPPSYNSEENDASVGSYAAIAARQPGRDADALLCSPSMSTGDSGIPTPRKRARIQNDDESSSSTSPQAHVRAVRVASNPSMPTSSDDAVNRSHVSTTARSDRRGSIGSNISFEASKARGGARPLGSRGISVGSGKAIASVAMTGGTGSITPSGTSDGEGIGGSLSKKSKS